MESLFHFSNSHCGGGGVERNILGIYLNGGGSAIVEAISFEGRID